MAIKTNHTGKIPPGTVETYSSTGTIPNGYLSCEGQTVAIATYPELYAVCGVLYGVAGPGDFILPDYRGTFLRGFDDGRGLDTGRVNGVFQNCDIRSHDHGYQAPLVNLGMSSGGSFQFQPRAGTTGLTGGTETRPRNISSHYIIKF